MRRNPFHSPRPSFVGTAPASCSSPYGPSCGAAFTCLAFCVLSLICSLVTSKAIPKETSDILVTITVRGFGRLGARWSRMFQIYYDSHPPPGGPNAAIEARLLSSPRTHRICERGPDRVPRSKHGAPSLLHGLDTTLKVSYLWSGNRPLTLPQPCPCHPSTRQHRTLRQRWAEPPGQYDRSQIGPRPAACSPQNCASRVGLFPTAAESFVGAMA